MAEAIYNQARSYTNITDRKLYLSSLSTDDKLLYTQYNSKVRQDKFKANPAG